MGPVRRTSSPAFGCGHGIAASLRSAGLSPAGQRDPYSIRPSSPTRGLPRRFDRVGRATRAPESGSCLHDDRAFVLLALMLLLLVSTTPAPAALLLCRDIAVPPPWLGSIGIQEGLTDCGRRDSHQGCTPYSCGITTSRCSPSRKTASSACVHNFPRILLIHFPMWHDMPTKDLCWDSAPMDTLFEWNFQWAHLCIA